MQESKKRIWNDDRSRLVNELHKPSGKEGERQKIMIIIKLMTILYSHLSTVEQNHSTPKKNKK